MVLPPSFWLKKDRGDFCRVCLLDVSGCGCGVGELLAGISAAGLLVNTGGDFTLLGLEEYTSHCLLPVASNEVEVLAPDFLRSVVLEV